MDSESKKAYHYVFAQKYTQQEVDEMLEQQREACEAAMYHAVRKYMPQNFPLDIVSEAILNARVEKSDIEWIRADKVEENVRNAFDAGYTRGHDISGARLLRMIQEKEDDK